MVKLGRAHRHGEAYWSDRARGAPARPPIGRSRRTRHLTVSRPGASPRLPPGGKDEKIRRVRYIMCLVCMPWGLLAVMTLAVFGQLVRPAVTLLVGLRLWKPIGDGLCLHTSHEMSSFPMRGYPLAAAVKPACRGASRALGRPAVVPSRPCYKTSAGPRT